MLAVFKPAVVVSVPRVFGRYATPSRTHQRRRANLRDRRADRGRLGKLATAADRELLLCHAVFDRLVYRKLRAAHRVATAAPPSPAARR